jgi:glyoxylase-like metal-dependent hydrolase (beta-lactamase superfamily II)
MTAPEIQHVVVGPFVQNAYLVQCPATKDAILVDPGFEPERMLEMIEEAEANVVQVVATHGHIDHVWGAVPVCEATGAPFRMHPADNYWLDGLDQQCQMFGLEGPPGKPVIDEPLADLDTIAFGEVTLDVMLTPGHTPGSVSLHDRGLNLLSGDTLFLGSIGRTDFPGGDFGTIVRSIRERLFALPPETIVHSGHGPATRIDEERGTNPFVGDHAGPAGSPGGMLTASSR